MNKFKLRTAINSLMEAKDVLESAKKDQENSLQVLRGDRDTAHDTEPLQGGINELKEIIDKIDYAIADIDYLHNQ